MAADLPHPLLLPHLDWGWRFRIALASLWLATAWTYYVVVRQRPGWPRLLLAAPPVACCFVVPLLFDPFVEPLTVMALSYMSFRMPATKVRPSNSTTAPPQHTPVLPVTQAAALYPTA